jgi:ABC-2 type transport system permease protein
MKAFWKIYGAQYQLFRRDLGTVLITFILPIVLGLFFSLIFNTSSQAGMNLTVVDQDGQREARYMIDRLISNARAHKLTIREATQTEALEALRHGKTDGVLIFTKGTSQAISQYEPCTVKIYYDPGRILSSGIARLVVQNIIAEINLYLSEGQKIFTAREFSVGAKQTGQNSLGEFYLPNFLAISFLWFSLFATALPLVKQREDKILLRMGVTPLSPVVFIAATVLWRLSLGIIYSSLFLLVGTFTIKLQVFQHLFLFILAIIVGNLAFIAMGFMIAAISRTTQRAELIAQCFNFGMMFLSGVFFATGMLPPALVKISYLIPLTYLGDLFRQLMAGYQGIVPIWTDFAVLLGSGLVFTGITVKCWRWK